ncbi:hypothetical protein D3C78_1408140 [compost metagenome]
MVAEPTLCKLKPLALSIAHSSSASGFIPPQYSSLKYLIVPELSSEIEPPYFVSAETASPSTFPVPMLTGAFPNIITAPQSPGALFTSAEVNTTGLLLVPLTTNLAPCVITIVPLLLGSSCLTKDIVVPAGIVKTALFFTYS